MFVHAWRVRRAAGAHRLDEYLQATRVSIGVDRVSVEIDLTAGTSVAASVFGWIDTDADGQLSGAERAAYARQVIDSVMLTADGHRGTLALNGCDFPDRREMAEGIGAVRLRASARIPTAASGRHVLTYLNSHRSESSVYLANALVPTDNRIAITSQRRDPSQHMLTLKYRRRLWSLAAGAAPGVGDRHPLAPPQQTPGSIVGSLFDRLQCGEFRGK